MIPRRIALALSFLLMAPLFPLTEATSSSTCEETPCSSIVLHARADRQGNAYLLSALGGDAAPGAPGTSGSSLTARTPVIERPLTIAKDSPFVVSLSASSYGSYAHGNISVFAEGAQSHLIARASYALPPRASLHDPSVPRPAQYELVEEIARDVGDALGDAINAFQGPLLSNAAAAVYNETCVVRQTVYQACEQINGRYGTGTVRGCSQPPAQPNVLGSAMWDAFNTADAAAHDGTIPRPILYNESLLGPARPILDPYVPASVDVPAWNGTRDVDGPGRDARVCQSTYGRVNATAAAADATVPQVGPFPDPRDTVGPVDWPFNETEHPSASPNDSWRFATLNATPPEWMLQDDSTFTVPSGMTLRWEVAITTYEIVNGQYVPRETSLRWGTAAYPSTLTVRTTTPEVFPMLAQPAETIGPGRHTGRFATPFDADDYTFQVAEGERGRVLPSSGVGFQLFDPHGAQRVGNSVPFGGLAGAWTLRVQSPNSAAGHVSEYAFDIVYEGDPEPTLDLAEGEHVDSLGPGDDVDRFAFFVWKRQAFALELTRPATSGYTLAFGAPVMDVTVDQTTGGSIVRARAVETGLVFVDVTRGHGEGAYTLSLDLDERGNLSGLPNVTPILDLGHDDVAAISGWRDGVDVIQSRSPYLYLRHVTPEGVVTEEATSLDRAPIRDGEGDLIYRDWAGLVERTDAETPIADVYAPAFAGETLYALGRTEGGYRLVQVQSGEAPVWHDYLIPSAWSGLRASPDGSLLIQIFGDVRADWHVLDPATGATTRAPEYYRVQAFDKLGGRFRVYNETIVEREDPTTGARVVVANVEGHMVYQIAAADGGLFLHLNNFTHDSLAYLPLATPGFTGFHPSFTPAAPADLVMTDFDDKRVGIRIDGNDLVEIHEVAIEVTNAGTGPAGNSTLRAEGEYRPWRHEARPVVEAVVPALEPGASAVIHVRLEVRNHAGDYPVVISLDVDARDGGAVVEWDEDNNVAVEEIVVLMGGNRDLCRELLDFAGMPIGGACELL